MSADLTLQVLEALSEVDGSILSSDAFPSIDFTTIKSALDRLGSREMIIYRQIEREEANLTPEAEGIAAEGSHEAKVFEAVRQAVQGLKIADLPVCRLNCTPARLDAIILSSAWLITFARVLWVRRAPRLARARLSRKDGSRRTRIFSGPPYVHKQCRFLRHPLIRLPRQTAFKMQAENNCRPSNAPEHIQNPKSYRTYGNES